MRPRRQTKDMSMGINTMRNSIIKIEHHSGPDAPSTTFLNSHLFHSRYQRPSHLGSLPWGWMNPLKSFGEYGYTLQWPGTQDSRCYLISTHATNDHGWRDRVHEQRRITMSKHDYVLVHLALARLAMPSTSIQRCSKLARWKLFPPQIMGETVRTMQTTDMKGHTDPTRMPVWPKYPWFSLFLTHRVPEDGLGPSHRTHGFLFRLAICGGLYGLWCLSFASFSQSHLKSSV